MINQVGVSQEKKVKPRDLFVCWSVEDPVKKKYELRLDVFAAKEKDSNPS